MMKAIPFALLLLISPQSKIQVLGKNREIRLSNFHMNSVDVDVLGKSYKFEGVGTPMLLEIRNEGGFMKGNLMSGFAKANESGIYELNKGHVEGNAYVEFDTKRADEYLVEAKLPPVKRKQNSKMVLTSAIIDQLRSGVDQTVTLPKAFQLNQAASGDGFVEVTEPADKVKGTPERKVKVPISFVSTVEVTGSSSNFVLRPDEMGEMDVLKGHATGPVVVHFTRVETVKATGVQTVTTVVATADKVEVDRTDGNGKVAEEGKLTVSGNAHFIYKKKEAGVETMSTDLVGDQFTLVLAKDKTLKSLSGVGQPTTTTAQLSKGGR